MAFVSTLLFVLYEKAKLSGIFSNGSMLCCSYIWTYMYTMVIALVILDQPAAATPPHRLLTSQCRGITPVYITTNSKWLLLLHVHESRWSTVEGWPEYWSHVLMWYVHGALFTMDCHINAWYVWSREFSVDQLKGKQLSPMFWPDALVVFRAKELP